MVGYQMKLNPCLHLACCTNVHRGETWPATFESLQNYTLPVRRHISPHQPFGIGLHLSNRAAHQLAEPSAMTEFQRWMSRNGLYVCTINGVAFGGLNSCRVKEQLYETDWRWPERLAYTNLLFDLMSRLIPEDVEGTVSTLPGSYKGFHLHTDEIQAVRTNLWRCIEHAARVSEQTGRRMHLGLEPEPLCLLESTADVVQFFDRIRSDHQRDPFLFDYLTVVYDTCHFAVEFEDPRNAVACLRQHGIRIGKIDFACALRTFPAPMTRDSLAGLAGDRLLHPVVVRRANGDRVIYPDVSDALAGEVDAGDTAPWSNEWRIAYQVPLNAETDEYFGGTTDHVLGIADCLKENPEICSHVEIETSVWEEDGASQDVANQVLAEYQFLLTCLAERGLANLSIEVPPVETGC